MPNNYSNIKELIELWEEYENSKHSISLKDFGLWLSDKKDKEDSAKEQNKVSKEVKAHFDFHNKLPLQKQFITLISRAGRFIDFYMKKAFEDLPIKSGHEFQFLITVNEMKNPRKTDLINIGITELSTGLETIKRMISAGLLEDTTDKNDKRVKRLQITKKGTNVLTKAIDKFQYLDKMIDTFNDHDKVRFLPSLIGFNDYHNSVFMKYKHKNFNELIQLLKIK